MGMKVFVWERIENATTSYHSQGGVVVFAADEARARELANATGGCTIASTERPDDVRDVDGGDEKVYIMADQGCC